MGVPGHAKIKLKKVNKRDAEEGNPETDELSLGELKDEIASTKGEIANIQIAAEKLTRKLEIFLGRKELVFKPDGQGYRIFRGDKATGSLSEGEKTAIAFVYFTVQLEDQDFDKTKGLIVIDDPISSLDSNSLFQAFSFLKVAVKDSHQLIVLTHNYDFLKLLINWMNNVPGGKNSRQYFMIENSYSEQGRRAGLRTLDPSLEKYPSEYLYLLSQIFNYECDGSIHNAYSMANIIRKALEHLLDFLCPQGKNFYKKLESLSFDEQKLTALNKFSQDFSHPTGGGFDPSLIQETRNAVTIMIELLRETTPTHFKGVCLKLGKDPANYI